MRKLLVWMLVCLLALAPSQTLAYESPADAAYSEGKMVRTVYSFEPAEVPFFNEEIQTAYEDMLNALSLVTIRQENEQAGDAGGVALTLKGGQGANGVLDLVWGSDANGYYLLSESGMLGKGVLAFSRDGILPETLKLVNGVSRLFGGPEITPEMVEQALMESAGGAQKLMEEMTPMMEAIGAKAMQLVAKATIVSGTVESDKHDAAETTLTLDLTSEDLASYYDVIVEEMLKLETFRQFLAAAQVTDAQGNVLKGEEGIRYFETSLRELPQMIRQLGLNARVEVLAGRSDLVALIVTLTAEGEEEAIVLDYYRKTEDQTAKHAFAVKGGAETLLDGEYAITDHGVTKACTLAVRAAGQPLAQGEWSYTVDKPQKNGSLILSDGTNAIGFNWNQMNDNWDFTLEVASNGQSQFLLSLVNQAPDFALRAEADGEAFVLTYDETETADKLAWILDLSMEADGQKASLLTLDSEAAAADSGEAGRLALSVMGIPCVTVRVNTLVLDPIQWTAFEGASVADMTDADASEWAGNTLSSLMTQVMTFAQSIPTSVLMLLAE